MPIQSRNPTTGEIAKTFSELTDDELKTKLEIAQATFEHWRGNDYSSRAAKLQKAAEVLKTNSRTYGELATLEMGKPIKQAIAEVEKCAWVCEYYAHEAERMLSPEYIKTDGTKSYVRFDPLGIVLAVMPWNFPFWQVFRFIAPASMAGNVGLLKHASNVPQCAAAIEDVFAKAGFPEGVFQNLYISSPKVESVLRDPRVKAVTLTGSEWAGRKVAEIAGDEIKHSVLELGGSDPFIVLADAKLEEACSAAVNARLQNNGQSCIAAKRFIVVESIAEQFVDLYIKKFESLSVGDPMNENTDLGPLVNEQSLNEIQKQINDSVAKGARILCGGRRIKCPGYFFEPTILGDVSPGMPAYEQEIFGPVASIIKVKDASEAIRVANDSRFGLGASLWTSDMNLAEQLAADIEAGAVFINSMVKSDPRLPFGGIKKSGYGRELSHYGIKEFVNTKTVWMK
ncbi:MAG: NAD-dependent succinate-semialdehyde dehydrogenase [Candidatus Magasanikbacteria bacterium]|nr:NAD-dependent succinate-semialdehyde dehydrogenase [Candidatus Magasanikbacteria bacterium]